MGKHPLTKSLGNGPSLMTVPLLSTHKHLMATLLWHASTFHSLTLMLLCVCHLAKTLGPDSSSAFNLICRLRLFVQLYIEGLVSRLLEPHTVRVQLRSSNIAISANC